MLRLRRMWIWRPANNRGDLRCMRALVKAVFPVMILNPSNHVVAVAAAHSAVATLGKSNLQDRARGIEKAPFHAQPDPLFLPHRNRGLAVGMNSPGIRSSHSALGLVVGRLVPRLRRLKHMALRAILVRSCFCESHDPPR